MIDTWVALFIVDLEMQLSEEKINN